VAAVVDVDAMAVIEFGDLNLDFVRLLEKVYHSVSHMSVKLSVFVFTCKNYAVRMITP
jgi:hypothetical protein